MNQVEKSELHLWLAFYLARIPFELIQIWCQHAPLSELRTPSVNALLALNVTEKKATQYAQALAKVSEAELSRLLVHCETSLIEIIHYDHPYYSHLLQQLTRPPLLLFCIGNTALLQKPQVAIVGSRSATEAGKRIAFEMAQGLTRQGILVTSGMALGIDGAAHQGAMSEQGSTLAVLGTGVDVCYPKRHRYLYQQICESGCVVSEYLPGAKALAEHFPRRNRIISGLSLGTLVVEAELRSGSLITANYAIEQNRDVFAVPSSIHSPYSKGPHQLIQQGAKLVTEVADICEELDVPLDTCLNYKDTVKKEEGGLLDYIGYEPTPVDEIASRANIPMPELMTRLLDLELDGKVQRVLDGFIKLGG